MRGSICIKSGALLTALALLLTNCSAPVDSSQQPSSSPTATASSPAPPPQPPSSTTQVVDSLEASFEELAATLPAGAAGIAITGEQRSLSFGAWNDGAAWSTIKVALAVAALRRDFDSSEPLVALAITQSDNEAADKLWASLGAPEQAAQAVEAVLADGGDPETAVQSQQVRPPYSAFGQTMWSQQQQARFAFGLPCVTSATTVIDQMRNLAPNQVWGLAGEDGVAAKGGWGPEPDGGYLVRQVALVTDESGTFGVALAAKPNDGSFDTGVAMVDKLGAWVLEHREQLPAGHCQTR